MRANDPKRTLPQWDTASKVGVSEYDAPSRKMTRPLTSLEFSNANDVNRPVGRHTNPRLVVVLRGLATQFGVRI